MIQLDPYYVLALLSSAATVIGVLFKLLMKAKEEKFKLILAERDSIRKSLEEINVEAIKELRRLTNKNLLKNKLARLKEIKPVIPEGSSPPTETQIVIAKLQTFRAEMVQIKEANDQPPRKEPK